MLNILSKYAGKRFYGCLAFMVWMIPVFAADHALDHEPLQRSPSLTYGQVFESALASAPEFLATSARQGQAAAYKAMGQDFFAGNPTLQTSYLDDSTLTDAGLMEFAAGFSIPLWRPGQKQEVRVLGRNVESMFMSWQAYTQWQVAGRMRQTLLAVQSAEAMLAFEKQSLTNSEALEQLSLALYQAGEAPELDLMATRAMLLDQRNRVYDAEVELVDAERTYQVVTGLNRIPTVSFQEEAFQSDEILSSHPWLSYLSSNVDVARSAVEQVRNRSTGSPVVGLGYRRERGNRFDQYIDTVGISVNIPIGKSATVGAAVSDARREEADLQVALQQARINLNQQLHEAEHQAFVASQKLAETEAKVALNRQRWEKSKLAYELGETNFYQVLMALEDLHSTEKERRSLELEIQLRNAEINQSLGIMP
jgi:outer membrane protein, heavy metal efflux system